MPRPTLPKLIDTFYIEGIKEGRTSFEKHGIEWADGELRNLESTIKGFDASSPVGQMLRGERDFWRNQIKLCQIAQQRKDATP